MQNHWNVCSAKSNSFLCFAIKKSRELHAFSIRGNFVWSAANRRTKATRTDEKKKIFLTIAKRVNSNGTQCNLQTKINRCYRKRNVRMFVCDRWSNEPIVRITSLSFSFFPSDGRRPQLDCAIRWMWSAYKWLQSVAVVINCLPFCCLLSSHRVRWTKSAPNKSNDRHEVIISVLVRQANYAKNEKKKTEEIIVKSKHRNIKLKVISYLGMAWSISLCNVHKIDHKWSHQTNMFLFGYFCVRFFVFDKTKTVKIFFFFYSANAKIMISKTADAIDDPKSWTPHEETRVRERSCAQMRRLPKQNQLRMFYFEIHCNAFASANRNECRDESQQNEIKYRSDTRLSVARALLRFVCVYARAWMRNKMLNVLTSSRHFAQ